MYQITDSETTRECESWADVEFFVGDPELPEEYPGSPVTLTHGNDTYTITAIDSDIPWSC